MLNKNVSLMYIHVIFALVFINELWNFSIKWSLILIWMFMQSILQRPLMPALFTNWYITNFCKRLLQTVSLWVLAVDLNSLWRVIGSPQFIAAKYFKQNISISFSVLDMSHSINESIHDGVYSIKFILKHYEPYLTA